MVARKLIFVLAALAMTAAAQTPSISSPPGGVVIGKPVTGGDAEDILFVDDSGNLGQNDNFGWSNTFGLGVNGNGIFLQNNGTQQIQIVDQGPAGISIYSLNALVELEANDQFLLTNLGNGGSQIIDYGTGGLNFDTNDHLLLQNYGNGGSQIIDYGTGGLNFSSAAQFEITNTGTGGTLIQDSGGGGFELIDSGNGGGFIQSNQGITISQTGPTGIYLDNTGGGGIELQDTGGGGIFFSSSSTYNFSGLAGGSSLPLCLTSAGNLEIGSLAAGAVTCP